MAAVPETVVRPAIEVDASANGVDDAADESDASSFVSSIATEIKRGKELYGRIYPNYGKYEYGLPVDGDEPDRLDLQHHKYNIALDDKLLLCPVPNSPKRIIDIATGTGIWAIDIADQYPEAEVIGTDIAPIQNHWVPPNCSFEIADAEEEWVYDLNSFDIVHVRDAYLAIRDFPAFMKRAYDHLKPGGWLEIKTVSPLPECDDGTLTKDSAYLEAANWPVDSGKSMGVDVGTQGPKYSEWMFDQGFRNIRSEKFKIPCSDWPKDPNMKKIGALERMNALNVVDLMFGLVAAQLGKTKEDVKGLQDRLKKELLTRNVHSYIPFYVAYGQKPA